MRRSAFAEYHPGVTFLYFAGAIAAGVLIQHPAYLLCGLATGILVWLTLKGLDGWKLIAGMVPVFLVISFANPLFNTMGRTVLFSLFGRPYTWEALCYGMAVGGMFAGMMVWFGCYNIIMTSDKFVCLFGNLIPSLSLLLVMVLRLIPSFMRKTGQILSARKAIGKGANARSSAKEKIQAGMTALSALTDWALEGSIVTADSMRARGYGTGKRTSFQIWRMTVRDWFMIGLEMGLLAAVVLAVATGKTEANYLYRIAVSPVSWHLAAYGVFLMIPVLIEGKEAVKWRIIRWKM